jgi:hypothetical protein
MGNYSATKEKSYRENLKHFEAPNIDNDTYFASLTPDRQESHLYFVRCANKAFADAVKFGIPEDYRANLEYYNSLDAWKRINEGDSIKNALVAFEDIYARDTAIARTIYRNSQWEKLGVDKETLANPRWQIKQYRTTGKERPQFTQEFSEPTFVKFQKNQNFDQGIGIQLGIQLGWQEMREAEGGLWEPLAILQSHAAEIFGVTKSRMSFRGIDIYKASFKDGSGAAAFGSTGLINDGSMVAFTAGDLTNLDAEVTGDGEVHDSIHTALEALDSARLLQDHRKILITSRGVAAEPLLEIHRDSYRQKSDMVRIRESYFDTGFLDGWMATDQIFHASDNLSIAPAAAVEQMMGVFALGPSLVREKIIYPTQVLPMADKEFVDDFKEIMIFAHCIQYQNVDTTINVFPAVMDDGMTSTTQGLRIKEGMIDMGMLTRQAFA